MSVAYRGPARLWRSKTGGRVHRSTCRHAAAGWPWYWAEDKPLYRVFFVGSWNEPCKVCHPERCHPPGWSFCGDDENCPCNLNNRCPCGEWKDDDEEHPWERCAECGWPRTDHPRPDDDPEAQS